MAIFPWFWLFPSTKSAFLCAFALRNPHFRVFQAQKRYFCVRNGDISLVLALPEHKIGIFVRFCQQVSSRWHPRPATNLIRRRKYSGLASNLAHLSRMRLSPGQGAAAGWQMMLPAESGTLPHRPWTTMSLVNGRTRKRSAAGGWSEAEVCAEEVADPRKPMWHHWKRLPIRGSRCVCSVEDLAALLGYSAGSCRCEALSTAAAAKR